MQWHVKRVFRNPSKMIAVSFPVGIVKIGKTMKGSTVWEISEDKQHRYVYKACRCSLDVSYPHVGMDLTGCQTIAIGCSNYVILSVSLFIQVVAATLGALC